MMPHASQFLAASSRSRGHKPPTAIIGQQDRGVSHKSLEMDGYLAQSLISCMSFRYLGFVATRDRIAVSVNQQLRKRPFGGAVHGASSRRAFHSREWQAQSVTEKCALGAGGQTKRLRPLVAVATT